jgi:hypothetical protein
MGSGANLRALRQAAYLRASVSPPVIAPVALPVRAKNAAHLPYPFNTMNPEDVPEEVWRRVRTAQAPP